MLREKSIVIYDLFHIEVEYRNIGSRSRRTSPGGPSSGQRSLRDLGAKDIHRPFLVVTMAKSGL